MTNNCLVRGRVLAAILLVVTAVLLVVPVAGSTNVYGPMVITAPGTYILQQDILQSDAGICIDIESSGVTFDGKGHMISGLGTLGSYGISVAQNSGSTSLSRVTVKNVVLKDWCWGLQYWNVTGGRIEKVSASNNIRDGLVLWSGCTGNTVTGNTLTGNAVYGLVVGWGATGNTIYNNYLKNEDNTLLVDDSVNLWGISRTPGTNILGGHSKGGNYWATPDGTGFSQTHPDTNRDGFCDAAYQLSPGNIDRLPLTDFVVSSPKARFTASPKTGIRPLTVSFKDTSTGGPTSFLWSFGDGFTSELENPTHTYTSAGRYTVTLKVSNAASSDTIVKAGSIKVR